MALYSYKAVKPDGEAVDDEREAVNVHWATPFGQVSPHGPTGMLRALVWRWRPAARSDRHRTTGTNDFPRAWRRDRLDTRAWAGF